MGAFPVFAILGILIVAHPSCCNGYMVADIQPDWFNRNIPAPTAPSTEPPERAPAPITYAPNAGQKPSNVLEELQGQIQELQKALSEMELKYNDALKRFSDNVVEARNTKQPLLQALQQLQGQLSEVEHEESIAKDYLSIAQSDNQGKIKEAHDAAAELKEKLYQCIDDEIAKREERWKQRFMPTEAPSGANTSDVPLAGVFPGMTLPEDSTGPVEAVRPRPAVVAYPPMPARAEPSEVTVGHAEFPQDVSTTDPTPVQGIRRDLPPNPGMVITTPPPPPPTTEPKLVPGIMDGALASAAKREVSTMKREASNTDHGARHKGDGRVRRLLASVAAQRAARQESKRRQAAHNQEALPISEIQALLPQLGLPATGVAADQAGEVHQKSWFQQPGPVQGVNAEAGANDEAAQAEEMLRRFREHARESEADVERKLDMIMGSNTPQPGSQTTGNLDTPGTAEQPATLPSAPLADTPPAGVNDEAATANAEEKLRRFREHARESEADIQRKLDMILGPNTPQPGSQSSGDPFVPGAAELPATPPPAPVAATPPISAPGMGFDPQTLENTPRQPDEDHAITPPGFNGPTLKDWAELPAPKDGAEVPAPKVDENDLCNAAQSTAADLKEQVNQLTGAKKKLDFDIKEAKSNRTNMQSKMQGIKTEIKDLMAEIKGLEYKIKMKAG